MLAVAGLTVTYDDFTAVDAVDLEVADREIVCILGPSGSGKSSLLRAIAGLEPDARGRVSWDGDDLARVPPHRRGFGLMFQDHALFPHRDVPGQRRLRAAHAAPAARPRSTPAPATPSRWSGSPASSAAASASSRAVNNNGSRSPARSRPNRDC